MQGFELLCLTFLVLISTIIGCNEISAFASLVGVLVGIASSAVRLKICETTAGINKYKSIINKKLKKDLKMVLLEKSKLDTIKILIYKTLIDSYTSHGKFVSVNIVLREYNDMKEEIKNPKNAAEYNI